MVIKKVNLIPFSILRITFFSSGMGQTTIGHDKTITFTFG